MSELLKKEYEFYLKNYDELIKQYAGKFLTIKDEKIIGIYNSDEEAYTQTIKNHELGTFLIQFCSVEDKKNIQTFHSRVIFA